MPQSDKQPPEAPPPRRNRAEAVGRDAGFVGGAAFARAGFRDPTLVLHWDAIVGTDVARFARPLRLSEGPSGGILTLRADPAAAVFLQHESRSLCERINAYLGRPAIHRLRFVRGALSTVPTPQGRAMEPPDAAPDDPARRFRGPEPLATALYNLARARRRPRD